MSRCIRKVATEVLGMSKGLGLRPQKSWWWNEEVQRITKAKRKCYRKLPKAEDGEAFEEYKISKREAKRLLVKSKRKL